MKGLPVAPMLARPFVTLREDDYPVFAQPKLNGVRALACLEGGEVRIWSRFSRRLRGLARIEAALAPLFAEDPHAVLDGEIYDHDLRDDLGATLSALRTGGGALAFWAFDLALPCVATEDRADQLEDLFAAAGIAPDHPHLRRVPTWLIEDDEDLALHFADHLAQGFEGQIVRAGGFYAPGRRAMKKRKPMTDAEFEVARIDPAAGPGRPAYAVCRSAGGTFRARIATGPLPPVATVATVRFAARTRAGKPLDTSVIAFHGPDGRTA